MSYPAIAKLPVMIANNVIMNIFIFINFMITNLHLCSEDDVTCNLTVGEHCVKYCKLIVKRMSFNLGWPNSIYLLKQFLKFLLIVYGRFRKYTMLLILINRIILK